MLIGCCEEVADGAVWWGLGLGGGCSRKGRLGPRYAQLEATQSILEPKQSVLESEVLFCREIG